MKDNILTLKEREELKYKSVGKQGEEYKIADLDELVKKIRLKRKDAGMDMNVKIKAIRTRRAVENHKTISFVKDVITGVYYGINIGMYEDGNLKWRKVYLSDITEFNLNNDIEAKSFIITALHPCCKGSPFKMGDITFEIIDPAGISKSNYKKSMKLREALNAITAIKEESALPFARFCTVDVKKTDPLDIIKAALMMQAQADPEGLLLKLNDPNRQYNELVFTAIHDGIIEEDVDRGFYFKNFDLGFTTSEVINKLMRDEVILARLRSDMEIK